MWLMKALRNKSPKRQRGERNSFAGASVVFEFALRVLNHHRLGSRQELVGSKDRLGDQAGVRAATFQGGQPDLLRQCIRCASQVLAIVTIQEVLRGLLLGENGTSDVELADAVLELLLPVGQAAGVGAMGQDVLVKARNE